MKKLFLILFLSMTGCGSGSTNTSLSLFVYGDSISAGGYPAMIAAQNGWALHNQSIGGTEIISQNQFPLIEQDIVNNTWPKGSIVFFAPGVNDGILNGSDSAYQSTYLSDITKILQDIELQPVIAYIGTPTHNCNEFRVANSIIDQYAGLTKQAVLSINAPNIILVDYNAKFIPTVDSTYDCYHPNNQGNLDMMQIFTQTKGL
jgi:hypothetical protein